MDLRTLARKKFLDIYGAFKTPSHGIHILNGHFIQLNVSGRNDEIFHNLLTGLKKKFDFIELPEACQFINARKTPSRPLLAFTFDDGFADCSNEIAPVLDLFHTKGAFFINPSVIEASKTDCLNFLDKALKIRSDKEFMTWEQIGCLHKKGHLIGNHTMHHAALRNLTLDEAFNEVNAAKKKLEETLQFKCEYFALPYGAPEYFDQVGIDAALECHSFIFTSCYYHNYYYNGHNRIFNRRHFEGNWPSSHINYFTSVKREW